MDRSTLFIPAGAGDEAGFCYAERARGERGLFVVLQDASPRAGASRRGFLRGAYREVIARYQSAARPETPGALLRGVVCALDGVARQVDTRVDDFRGLGIHVLVVDGGRAYLLCGRDAPTRLRVSGVMVPVGPGVAGAREVGIETVRAQHDLFSQSLTDSLALYRFELTGAGHPLEFFLGGQADDVAAALDALEVRRGGGRVTMDRGGSAVMAVSCAPRAAHAQTTAAPPARRRARTPAGLTPRRAALGSVAVLALALVFFAAKSGLRGGSTLDAEPQLERASQERPTPRDVRSEPEATPQHAEEVAAVTPPPQDEDDGARAGGFAEAWQRVYSDAVTSSPARAGDAVVFGARDGHVYALAGASGERKWTHDAGGGVGASPVVSDEDVFVCDYSGRVVRLARDDGRVRWTRALKEKIISTPAVTGERVFVGTTHGNVYALSRDSGRVLWKFRTRGQIRGSLVAGQTLVFVPSHDGKLYALLGDTGASRWSASLGGAVSSTPALDGGRLYVGTARGQVLALDAASGEKRWSFSTGGAVNAWIAAADGRVYAGSNDRTLYCLGAAGGDLLWKYATGGVILSRPEIAGGRVLVTSYDGAVYCLDAASGRLEARFDTPDPIFSSPLVMGGRVFFGNNGGRFFGLDLPH